MNKDWTIKTHPPSKMSSIVTKARQQSGSIKNNFDAVDLIKNNQDIKNLFWKKVIDNEYTINTTSVETLKSFLSI